MIFFILITCKKECGMKNDKTARKLMKGTWEVSEVKADSITLSNTGEKFRFFNYENYQGEGIFTTLDGKEESFVWNLKGNTFSMFPDDTSYVSNKYTNYMQSVKECKRKKIVFNQINTLTLERN